MVTGTPFCSLISALPGSSQWVPWNVLVSPRYILPSNLRNIDGVYFVRWGNFSNSIGIYNSIRCLALYPNSAMIMNKITELSKVNANSSIIYIGSSTNLYQRIKSFVSSSLIYGQIATPTAGILPKTCHSGGKSIWFLQDVSGNRAFTPISGNSNVEIIWYSTNTLLPLFVQSYIPRIGSLITGKDIEVTLLLLASTSIGSSSMIFPICNSTI